MNPILDLVSKIREANESYRTGSPQMSDIQYDILRDQLELIDPNNEVFFEIGHVIMDESRKATLPTKMASMNKHKTLISLTKKWLDKNLISLDDEIVLSPKMDGAAFTIEEQKRNAFTRGDGTIGQKSNEHFEMIQNNTPFLNNPNIITYGEVVMPRDVFIEKYSAEFANPRNLVSGLLNTPNATEPLTDCVYIKYGIADESNFLTKCAILDYLNENQATKIQYQVIKVKNLTEQHLIDLFKKWSDVFDIDGIILEVNSIEKRNALDRERNGNPAWARAFKHASFEMTEEATVTALIYDISKQGFLKPVIHINPTKLDGATVSKITGNNARFIKKMGIGVGSRILVKRSGMVIPLVVAVLETVEFTEPSIDGVEIGWNTSGAELMTLTVTDEQRFKQAVSFFEILGAERFAVGTIRNLWTNGYNTIAKICNISLSELSKLDGFGDKKPQITLDGIKKSLKNVPLSKIQHASGFFKQLGSKKLLLLEHFEEVPTINEIILIDGFAEVSANAYLDGIIQFSEFIKELPTTIIKKVTIDKVSDDLVGKTFVFTGVRSKELEILIESRGGKIASSVSKNTTHLIMKTKGSGSSKENKAIDLGIEILTLPELEKLLTA
jgi:DNA ligase (NAD+)